MATSWFKQNQKLLNRFKNLSVIYVNIDEDIEELCERSMTLQANISDSELDLINEDNTVSITEVIWK